MRTRFKVMSVAMLGLLWLSVSSGAHAYSWDFTLTPSDATTLDVHPGESIDVFANISNQGTAPLTILDSGGCLDFPGARSGNEGFTIGLDTANPHVAFDLSTSSAPPATVAAGSQQSFLIGTLRILSGAPDGLAFHVQVDLTPDPVIDPAGGSILDTPSPGTLSASLSVHVAAVPEPESWLLMAVGTAILLGRRLQGCRITA